MVLTLMTNGTVQTLGRQNGSTWIDRYLTGTCRYTVDAT